jgi:hypothetical protein
MLIAISDVLPTCARSVCVAAFAASVFATASLATPAAAQTTGSAADLQTLVDDLGTQLELRYRANLPEYQLRYDQLGQAIAAWNASSQTDADRAAVASWLREATLSSMPGSDLPMPPVPQYDQPKPKVAAEADSPPVGIVTKKPVVPDQPDVSEEPLPEAKEPAAQTDQQPEPQSDEPTTDESPAAKQPVAVETPEKAPADQADAAETPAKGLDATDVPAVAPSAQPAATPAAVDTPAKVPADQPAATESVIPDAGNADAEPSDDAKFWVDHPAAGDLPDDVMVENPFLDDPLPADDAPLPAMPVLPNSPQ